MKCLFSDTRQKDVQDCESHEKKKEKKKRCEPYNLRLLQLFIISR